MGHSPNLNLRVVDLIDNVSKTWNMQILQQYIGPEDIALILSMCPSRVGTVDGYCWHYSNSGMYTVHSDYELVRINLDEELRFSLQQPSLNPQGESVEGGNNK